jgi:hypothetical protein
MTWQRIAFEALVGFPLGLFVSNGFEWFFHKHVLHGVGKRKGTFWNFHWYEHHAESRRADMLDPAYATTWLTGGLNARSKEALSLLGGALIGLPFVWLAPGFTIAALYSNANYYYKHRKAHLDPEWARTHLPWHVDHHMGPDQDANWCVTRPWFDVIMGTRKPFIGSDKDKADRARRSDRHAAQRLSNAPL